uniref:Uncharacterized protein n=1 Tax=Dulem virus 40 TaxID=3145758 RepID=A0AAU8AX30_9CAUD
MQTSLQGERTIGRHDLMEKVNVQARATICDLAPKQRSDR